MEQQSAEGITDLFIRLEIKFSIPCVIVPQIVYDYFSAMSPDIVELHSSSVVY